MTPSRTWFRWRSRRQVWAARACTTCGALVAEVDLVCHARFHREGPGMEALGVTEGGRDRVVYCNDELAEVHTT